MPLRVVMSYTHMSTVTCLISLQEAAFWAYAVRSYFITLGPWAGKRVYLRDFLTSFFQRGYLTFLAGHRKDPEKTIRKGPELPLFLASFRVFTTYWSSLLYSYYRLPILWWGNRIVPLYPEEQQYSEDA